MEPSWKVPSGCRLYTDQMARETTPMKAILIVCLFLICGASRATVCFPQKQPLEDARNRFKHVFIARIVGLSWDDPFKGQDVDIEYPSGVIRAKYEVLENVKGSMPEFPELTFTIYPNSSSGIVSVARDYVIFTDDGEVQSPNCNNATISLWYNAHKRMAERLRSEHPDRF